MERMNRGECHIHGSIQLVGSMSIRVHINPPLPAVSTRQDVRTPVTGGNCTTADWTKSKKKPRIGQTYIEIQKPIQETSYYSSSK
jgi:hypothetical protein